MSQSFGTISHKKWSSAEKSGRFLKDPPEKVYKFCLIWKKKLINLRKFEPIIVQDLIISKETLLFIYLSPIIKLSEHGTNMVWTWWTCWRTFLKPRVPFCKFHNNMQPHDLTCFTESYAAESGTLTPPVIRVPSALRPVLSEIVKIWINRKKYL